MMTMLALISILLPVSWAGEMAAETPALSNRAPAAIDRSLVAIAQPSKLFGGGRFVPASFRAAETPPMPKLNVSAYIPLDLRPTHDLSSSQKNSVVFGRIADQSVTSLINSPEFRSSALGATTTKVEKTVKQEVVIKGAGQNPVDHKLNFQIQAFQAVAKIEYRGIASVDLSYRAHDAEVEVQVAESVGTNRNLVLVHSKNPVEEISQIRMSWGF